MRADAKEQARQQTREAERSHDSNSHSDRGQGHPTLQDQAELIPATRAEGRAHSHFMGTLGDGVGNHPVDANRGEHQRQPGESAQQHSPHAVLAQRV